jgi:hypothetical protein
LDAITWILTGVNRCFLTGVLEEEEEGVVGEGAV